MQSNGDTIPLPADAALDQMLYRAGRPDAAVDALNDVIAPLAGLILFRWAASHQGDSGKVSKCGGSSELSLSKSIQELKWTEPLKLISRIRLAIDSENDSEARQTADHAIMAAVQRSADRNESTFATLVDWVAQQDFTTSQIANLRTRFEHLVARANLSQVLRRGYLPIPRKLCAVMMELANPQPGERIYNPACGLGELLMSVSQRCSRGNSAECGTIVGIENNPALFVVGLCRATLTQTSSPVLRLGDPLTQLPRARDDSPRFDCVVTVPPWHKQVDDEIAKLYSVPTRETEGLYLQHVMESLRPGGRGVILVPSGSLTRTGALREIRKLLVEKLCLDDVVSLPSGALGPYTAIRTSILVFRRDNPRAHIRFASISTQSWAGIDESFATQDRVNLESVIDERGEQSTASRHTLHEPLSQAGDETWNLERSAIVEREYDLSVRHIDARELEGILEKITTEGTSIAPLLGIADVTLGVPYDRTVTTSDPKTTEGAIPLLRVSDISASGTRMPNLFLTGKGASRAKDSQILKLGDIVISTSGTVGKASTIVDRDRTIGAAAAKSTCVIRIRSPEGTLIPEFLSSLLQSPAYVRWMYERATGSTINYLSLQTLQGLPVPIVPTNIQDAVLRRLPKGGDALSLLVRFVKDGTSDPIAEWLERSAVVEFLTSSGDSYDIASRLSSFGNEVLALRPLRNQVAHGEGPQLHPLVNAWLLAFFELGRLLANIDAVPKGAPRITILEMARNRLGNARNKLGHEGLRRIEHNDAFGDASSQTDETVIWQLHAVMRELDRALETGLDESLSAVTLQFNVTPAEVISDFATEIHLTLTNASALGVRSIDVTTQPDVGTGHTLYLGANESLQIPLLIRADRSQETFDVVVHWHASRLDGQADEGEANVQLLVRGSARAPDSAELEPSPYIVGNPVDRDEMFYGRHDVIAQIRRQLGSGSNANTILLEGNRRTGKTSILKQLQKPHVLPGWITVYCSFQEAEGHGSKVGVPTNEIYRYLAGRLGRTLSDAGIYPTFPGGCEAATGRSFQEQLEATMDRISSDAHPFEIFEEFLAISLEAAKPNGILLMLDEFDKLQEGIDEGITSPQVPENIRHILQHHRRLAAILTGSRRLKRLRE